ncbi:hypothetical protein MASR2M78_27660 [Treponema sp.]
MIIPDEDVDVDEENWLDAVNVVQPDLVVICDKKKLIKQGCLGAPDLAVEILSPYTSKKDLNEKFHLFERAGVREYWVIHPLDQALALYLRGSDGKFGSARMFQTDQVTVGTLVESHIFPGLTVKLAELFAE